MALVEENQNREKCMYSTGTYHMSDKRSSKSTSPAFPSYITLEKKKTTQFAIRDNLAYIPSRTTILWGYRKQKNKHNSPSRLRSMSRCKKVRHLFGMSPEGSKPYFPEIHNTPPSLILSTPQMVPILSIPTGHIPASYINSKFIRYCLNSSAYAKSRV